ncbi:SMI1/KNR4 family protein [Streptomyces sp. NPDC057474]|uniref:SMI1/KNR4 family protein n=1 Tax=Streptomyces sp. NPDC057474 TaxID=3346144 RepID=UPI00369040A6
MTHESLAVLRHAAEAGTVTITASGPASAESVHRRETGLKPHFGTIHWTAPPSYRSFLAEHNTFTCRGEFGHDIVLVGDEDMVELNSNTVHMPEHMDRGDGRCLSTNHLVGFADSGAEAIWCFDITQPGVDGEYPVYLREQDEPRARLVDNGDWEDPDDSAPDFPSFAAWLDAMTRSLTAPEPPGCFLDLRTPDFYRAGHWRPRRSRGGA